MSFSVDGSSREAIQAIQFELWPDCLTKCSFCYLNGTKRVTTPEEKKANIQDMLSVLQNADIMKDYNAVGLIGGDFFQGQLEEVRKDWDELIGYLSYMLETKQIKEVWLATSLLYMVSEDLLGTLDILNRIPLDEDQRIMVCTSFDTVGRFKSRFSMDDIPQEELEDEKLLPEILESFGCTSLEELKSLAEYNPALVEHWLNNIGEIRANYSNVNIHVQIILTQDVINKLIENPNYFDFITDAGCIIDFRYPSITRADCPTATQISDYRSLLLARYNMFPEHFFIEDRVTFLKCLKIFCEKYGLEKVKNLIHQPEMRSRRLKIYVDNAEIEDRWNDERDVYLECGHLVDGLCYINDDTHCIYCDIEKFIKTQENI